jgi:hypothetical protein
MREEIVEIEANLICPDCNSEFTGKVKETRTYTSVNKYRLKREYPSCACGSADVSVKIEGAALISIRGNITTVGQLAEANTKKLGKYGKQERDRKNEEANKAGRKELGLPDTDKVKRTSKLATMTPQQAEKYIYTGEGL